MKDSFLIRIVLVIKITMISVNVCSQSISLIQCPDNNHPHAIDLGLESGTKWSCCNLDASNPFDNGGYYAWGETTNKEEYSLLTYSYCRKDGWGDYHYIDVASDSLNIINTSYDVVHKKMGNGWRMPSKDDISELCRYCRKRVIVLNGVFGCLFIGKNNNKVFLPAAGFKKDKKGGRSNCGFYWTGTNELTAFDGRRPCDFYFDEDKVNCDDHGYQYSGGTIRPVLK